jgi:hypothetical protein
VLAFQGNHDGGEEQLTRAYKIDWKHVKKIIFYPGGKGKNAK